MPRSIHPLYKAHVKNLQAVTEGISHIQRQLNSCIANEDKKSTQTLINIYLLLAGAWAECRLKKVLYEPNGFDDSDRDTIQDQRSQTDRWKKALELGFRKRHNVPNAVLSPASLPGTAWFRYQAVIGIINSDLEPLIEMRNSFAHGQWKRPLNSAESAVNSQMIAAIQRENALSVKFKLSIITNLAELIHDLSAAASFERDFDKHYGHIIAARQNLTNRSYLKWQRDMIAKQSRGRQLRDNAIRQITATTPIVNDAQSPDNAEGGWRGVIIKVLIGAIRKLKTARSVG